MKHENKSKEQLIKELKNANLQNKKQLNEYHKLYEELINEKRKLTKANLALEKSNRLLSQAIRESHENEENLKESQQFWSDSFNSLNDVMMIIDREFTIEKINQIGLDLLDLPREEVIGKKCYELMHGSEQPVEDCPLLKALESQTVESMEWYEETFDEYFSLKRSPIFNENGEIIKFVDLMRTITERKHAEEELQKNLIKYEVIFESFPLGLTISDKNGKILESNKRSENLLGISSTEQIQRKIDSGEWKIVNIHGSPMNPEEYASVKALRENKLIENVEMGIVKDKGEITWINVTAAPIPLEDYGVAIAYGDITEQKKAEAKIQKQNEEIQMQNEELRVSNEELVDANRELGELMEKLRRNERELQLTLEATTDGIWTWNFQTDELEFSPRYYIMLGYSPDEFPASFENWKNLIHPDDVESAMSRANEWLTTKTGKYENEFRLRTQDGDYRWIRTTGNVVERDEAGTAIRMIGNHEDITDRKQAERELSRIFNMATELICVANINTATFTRINPAFTQVLGYDTSELLGRPFLDFVHPDDVEDTISVIENQLKQGESVISFVNRYRCKDGSYRWLDWNSHPKPEEGFTYAIATDITDRKHAEEKIQKQNEEIQMQNEELRVANEELIDANRELSELMEKLQESEKKYRTYINNAPEGIFITDAFGNYIDVNPAACQMTGYSREELLSLSIPELDITDDSSEDMLSFKDLKKIGRAKTERVLQHKDGSLINVLLNAVRLSEDRYIGFCTDITQRKQMEEKLHLAEYTIENATYATFWINFDGSFVRVNNTACRLLGYSREELLNMGVDDVDPNYPMAKRGEFWSKLKRSGSVTIETNHQTKDGTLFPVEVSTFYISYKDQEYEVAMSRDITERKHAEDKIQKQNEEIQMQNEELRVSNEELVDANRELGELMEKLQESQAILEAAMDQSQAGIAIADAPDGRLRYVNDAGLLIRRGTREEVVKDIDIDQYVDRWHILHLDGTPYKEKEVPLARAVLYGETCREEFIIRRDDNEDRIVLAHAAPIYDVRGNITAGIVVFLDITERKQAAHRIKLNEDRLSSLLTLTQMKAYTEKEVINYALEEAIRLTQSDFGYFHFIDEDKVNLNRFTWSNKVMKECNAPNIKNYPIDNAGVWMDSFRKGEPVIHNDYQNMEDKTGYPEGHVPIIRHMSVPIFDGKRIVAVAGVGNKETDYTDFDVKQLILFMNSMWGILKNKRAEEQLKRTLEEKTTLIQELYHRTRNNMQVICSMLSLKSRYLDDERNKELFKEMENRIYSMALVHEKLYQSKHLSRLDLQSYFQEVAYLLTGSYQLSLGKINFKFDTESMRVLFDTAIPCGLILNELVSNALKHAFPENREGTIKIGLHKPESDVIEFSVSDDGIGVPDNFDWRQDGNFGLGIVESIAEHQLQGTVEFDTQNGVGWKITFKVGFYNERV